MSNLSSTIVVILIRLLEYYINSQRAIGSTSTPSLSSVSSVEDYNNISIEEPLPNPTDPDPLSNYQIIPQNLENQMKKTSLIQFCLHEFSNLAKYYVISPLPSTIGFQYEGTPTRNQPNTENSEEKILSRLNVFIKLTKINPQIFVSICYHLIGILKNLGNHSETMDQLIRFKQMNALLELFHYCITICESGDVENNRLFIPIFRQFIRALCNLMETSTNHLKRILILKKLKVVHFFIAVLAKKALPSIICLELCQLLVYTIRRSSQLSLKLFHQFKKSDGYNVLAENLAWMERNGSRHEIVLPPFPPLSYFLSLVSFFLSHFPFPFPPFIPHLFLCVFLHSLYFHPRPCLCFPSPSICYFYLSEITQLLAFYLLLLLSSLFLYQDGLSLQYISLLMSYHFPFSAIPLYYCIHRTPFFYNLYVFHIKFLFPPSPLFMILFL